MIAQFTTLQLVAQEMHVACGSSDKEFLVKPAILCSADSQEKVNVSLTETSLIVGQGG